MLETDTQTKKVDNYVDREEQIQKFNEALRRIRRRRPVTMPLFEWHGGPGIGKTTLVGLLSRECDEKHIPWALVDFRDSEERTAEYLYDPTVLIEDIVTKLQQKIQLDVKSLQHMIKEFRAGSPPEQIIRAYFKLTPEQRLYEKPAWIDGLRNVMSAFMKLVNAASQDDRDRIQPVAFFFDEGEYAPVELIDWVEEWIINPLVQKKYCVIVWTARRPWRWKRPEIRRRLQSEALLVFDPDEVKEQVQRSISRPGLAEELFNNVYGVTGGHPFANAVVITQLQQWVGEGETVTAEYFSERAKELLDEIFEKFIREYAFYGLSEELRMACELLAMVRLFDTTMLRAILTSYAEDEFKAWDQEDFGDLLLELKKTQLLVWEKGFALDPNLRYIIRYYYSVCDKPTYLKANQTALEVYQSWLERPVDNRNLFVIEEIYHYSALYEAGESVSLEDELAKRLQQYPKWIQDGQALHNALERLKGELEYDNELNRLTAGVSSIKLVKQIRDFMDSISIS